MQLNNILKLHRQIFSSRKDVQPLKFPSSKTKITSDLKPDKETKSLQKEPEPPALSTKKSLKAPNTSWRAVPQISYPEISNPDDNSQSEQSNILEQLNAQITTGQRLYSQNMEV